MRKYSYFIMISFFAGCTSRSATVMAPVPNQIDSRPAIIVIPGFYGSALKDKRTGRKVFLTAIEALTGNSALSLHQSELGTPGGPELEVAGMLGAVPVLPGLYEVDVYSEFVHNLRAMRPDAQILPLPYDWRDDIFEAVGKLDEIMKILVTKNCKDVSIVAHSMGGLVAAYYLGYGGQPFVGAQINWFGAQIIKRVAFFGTPFGGTMIAFRSFEKGSDLARSQKLLPADAMGSFPSMYQMLPSTVNFLDKTGAKHLVDMFDPEFWKKNKLGLFRRGTIGPSFLEARGHFVTENLAKAKKFSELVQLGRTNAWQLPAQFQVLNVVGSGRDTLDSAYLDAASGKLLFDPEEVQAAGLKMAPLFNNGDGTVTLTSSTVPAALESVTKQIISEYSHDKLFLDPGVEKEYKVFLEKP